MNSMKSETPDTAVLTFNSMYEEIFRKNAIGENVTKKYIQQMAESIWRICFYIVNGSPKEKIILDHLQDLYENNIRMRLDLSTGVSVVVEPPNKSSNSLSFNVGEQSIFQYGNLKVQLIGKPKLLIDGDEISIVSRLKYLYELLESTD